MKFTRVHVRNCRVVRHWDKADFNTNSEKKENEKKDEMKMNQNKK